MVALGGTICIIIASDLQTNLHNCYLQIIFIRGINKTFSVTLGLCDNEVLYSLGTT